MKVTVFRDIFTKSEPQFQDVGVMLERIKNGESKDIIDEISSCKDKETADNLKKRLPSICFSGKFSQRAASYLLEHSGLICLDLDDIDSKDLDNIRGLIQKDEYTMSCFISPRGNGLKVLVKILPSPGDHKGFFQSLEKHFNEVLKSFVSIKKNEKSNWKKTKEGKVKINEAYGDTMPIDLTQGEYLIVCIDKSGKDVSRVCFESYDPQIYYNPESEIWEEIYDESFTTNKSEKYLMNDDIIAKLRKWIDGKENYVQGNRNNYLSKFAYALCRYGIPKELTESYFRNEFSDYPEKEIKSTVSSCYRNGQYGIEEFTPEQLADKKYKVNSKHIENKPINEFWLINDKGKVKIESRSYLDFIEANGFGVYRFENDPKNIHFIRAVNMIVEIVGVLDIKKCVLDFVKKHAPEIVYDEMQMRNRYFETSYLNALEEKKIEQVRDSKDKILFFFEGFYYEVTKDKILKKTYPSLEGRHIWKSQICKKTITEYTDNYKNHDFNRFVRNSICKGDQLKEDKYLSAVSSIGYGLHTYKKQSLAKLVYTCDEVMNELDGGAEGGTGKNLFQKCLEYARSVVYVDGKDFDKKDKFKFQSVNEDTQIVIVDDYEGDIKEMFTKVTGHFEIEKKGLDKTSLPFEKAPKLMVSSNSAPKGYSNSYTRRMHLLEFSNHYNANRQPSDDFNGRDFFSDDWTQNDWNCLYSFLFKSAQSYLENGLKVYKSVGIEYKQLFKNTSPVFAEWIKVYIDQNISLESVNIHTFYDDFREDCQDDKDKVTLRQFYVYLRKFAQIYGKKYTKKGRGDDTFVCFD